jgi:hypothetical protein
MDFTKFLDWIKLSPKYLAAIGIFAGGLLFTPQSFTETLGLLTIIGKYRPWIGLVFFLTIALLAAHAFDPIVKYIKGSWNGRKVRKLMEERLHNLTPDEKAIMRGYILQDSRTQYLRPDDGVVSGLQSAKVIYQASQVGGAGFSFRFAFNIQPWAWDYLNKHRELIEEGENELYHPDTLLRR